MGKTIFHTSFWKGLITVLTQGYDPDFVGLISHYSTKAIQCETMQC